MRHDPRRLFAHLYFGYEPDRVDPEYHAFAERHADGWRRRRDARRDVPFETLVDDGKALLERLFERKSAEIGNDDAVVRLSGGLDSRVILARLLEHVDRSRIIALTVGTKGSFDYEIAGKVARYAGVRHERLDLSDLHWSTEDLVECARAMSVPAPFVFGQRFAHYKAIKRMGPGPRFWDGYWGDRLAGSSVAKSQAGSWRECGAYFVRSIGPVCARELLPAEHDPASFYPEQPWLPEAALNYFDQLELLSRQPLHIRSGRVLAGVDFVTPFFDPEWMSFWFTVPRRFRAHQALYKAIVSATHRSLFRIPSTRHPGGSLLAPEWQKSIRRRLHALRTKMPLYRSLHAENGFTARYARERADVAAVIAENISDLAHRALIPWFDPQAILRSHLAGADYHSTLTTLVSLEINLKATEGAQPSALSQPGTRRSSPA